MTLVARDDETLVCAFRGMAGAVIVMAEPQWPQKFAPASNSAPHVRHRRIKPLALPPPCAEVPGTSCAPDGILLAGWRESKRGKRAMWTSVLSIVLRLCRAERTSYALFASMRSSATLAQRAVSASTVT